jgi:hypothetical protein
MQHLESLLSLNDATNLAGALTDASHREIRRQQLTHHAVGGPLSKSDVAWAAMRRVASAAGLPLLGARDGLDSVGRSRLARSLISRSLTFAAVSPWEFGTTGTWASTAIVVHELLPLSAASVTTSDGRRFVGAVSGGAWVSGRVCPAGLRWEQADIGSKANAISQSGERTSARRSNATEPRGAAALLSAVLDDSAFVVTHPAAAPWRLAAPLVLAISGYTVAGRTGEPGTGPEALLERFLTDLVVGRISSALDIASPADIVTRAKEQTQ